jgi:hypothetical protein
LTCEAIQEHGHKKPPIDKRLPFIYFAVQSLNRMNDLNKALGDISSIRRQMAQSGEFRGYGPTTLASTGVLAMAAAGAQALWLPDPANHIAGYLSIWIGTAAMSAALLCSLTDGNLSRHLRGLEKDKMVGMVKQYHRHRPQAVCHITPSGRERYVEYLSTLEQVVRDAAKMTKEGPAAGLIRGLAPSRG